MKPKILQRVDELESVAAEHTLSLAENVQQISNLETNKAKKEDLITTNSVVATKAPITYVDEKVAAVASDTPKGIFNTLLELQTTYPTGTTGKYIVGAPTEEKHWYIWFNNQWTDGGVYQGKGVEKGSIGVLEISDDKENMLNKVNITTGYSVNATGVLIPNIIVSVTDYIDIHNIEKVDLKNALLDGENIYPYDILCAFYDMSNNFISYIGNKPVGLFTLYKEDFPANAYYIRVNIGKAESLSSQYLYVYKSIPEWLDIKSYLKRTKVINPTTFLNDNYNLLNDTSITSQSYVDASGNISTHSLINITTFIDVSAYSKIGLLNEIGGYPFAVKGAFYNSEKVFISPIISNVLGNITVDVPVDAKYMIVNLDKDSIVEYINPYIKSPTWIIPENQVFFSKWKDKKAVFLGDSITEGTCTVGVTKPYTEYIKELLGLREAVNYGIGGTRISGTSANNFCSRYDDMDRDADLIVVMGGTNDALYPEGGSLLGTINDINKGNISFYGGVDFLCKNLKEIYPDSSVVFLTPMHYRPSDDNISHEAVDDIGLGLYAKAIKEVCEINGVPVIDFRNICGLNPNIESIKNKYFADLWIHPNQQGIELYSKRIYKNFELI